MLQIQKANIPNTGVFEEIVPIYETMFGNMVNARELHGVLGVKKKFADWIKHYTNKEYTGYNYGDTVNHPSNPNSYDYFMYDVAATQKRGRSVEYMLTLDMAKEIAMMSRCENGRIIRKYFIDVENAFKTMLITLQSKSLSNQEKIAEALLISHDLLIQKDEEIKKANRNKEYNKKVNIKLRREIRELKARIETLPMEGHSDIQKALEAKEELLKAKEEELAFLEGSFEILEDKHTRLQSRLNHLLKMKLDGRSILNAFATVDINRRQKFAMGDKAKEQARVKSYKFRKDSILNAGIIVNDEPGKTFVDTINVSDLEKAVVAYVASLKKLINDDNLFLELFEDQLIRANEFLEKAQFEKENNELEEKEIVY